MYCSRGILSRKEEKGVLTENEARWAKRGNEACGGGEKTERWFLFGFTGGGSGRKYQVRCNFGLDIDDKI